MPGQVTPQELSSFFATVVQTLEQLQIPLTWRFGVLEEYKLTEARRDVTVSFGNEPVKLV